MLKNIFMLMLLFSFPSLANWQDAISAYEQVATPAEQLQSHFQSFPLKRVEPTYPMTAARNGQAGYVKLYFLVNEHGEAVNIKIIDSFPGEVFTAAAIQALTQWQYPTNQPHLASVTLSFTLDVEGKPRINLRNLDKALFHTKLWDSAQAGSAEHQFFLSQLLQYVAEQSDVHFLFDAELPISKPDLSLLKQRNTIKADLTGFSGTAVVQTDDQGQIVALLEESDSANRVLLGQKLQGVSQARAFRLQSYLINDKEQINVVPAITMSNAWSAAYWLEQSAKHGYRPAQRILATKYDAWLHYLVTQQDPEALVWQGAKWILAGELARGKLLLEKAKLAGYQDAALWQKALHAELTNQ